MCTYTGLNLYYLPLPCPPDLCFLELYSLFLKHNGLLSSLVWSLYSKIIIIKRKKKKIKYCTGNLYHSAGVYLNIKFTSTDKPLLPLPPLPHLRNGKRDYWKPVLRSPWFCEACRHPKIYNLTFCFRKWNITGEGLF